MNEQFRPPARRPSEAILAELIVERGQQSWRVKGPLNPTGTYEREHLGPAGGRFDFHLPPPRLQKRGVLYLARSEVTCFAEVFEETRTIDTRRREPWLVGFHLADGVSLLRTDQNWPTLAGASMAINSGSRERARAWARDIYGAYPELQGIWYCSSLDANRPAIALSERARAAIPARPEFHRALSDATVLGIVVRAGRHLNYRVV